MPHINDIKFATLRDQGYVGALPDMLIDALKATGAVGEQYNDLLRSFLDNQGYSTGSVNDDMLAYLRAQGYTGAISDMLFNFWVDGGFSALKFFFNAVGGPQNQYAIFNTDWTPNGLPFEISVNAVPLTVDSSNRWVWAGGASTAHRNGVSNTNEWESGWVDSTGAISRTITGAVINEQTSNTVAASGLTNLSAGGVSSNDNPAYKIGDAGNVITRIASNVGGTGAYFHGPIWELKLTDNSPMSQGTTVVEGNGIRHGVLGQAATVGSNEAMRLSFDWIRTDFNGTSDTHVCSGSGVNTRLRLYDTGGTNAHRVRITLDNAGSVNFDGALANVALGQHVHIELSRDMDGVWELKIDGVVTGTPGAINAAGFKIDELFANVSGGLPFSGGAFQNIILANTTTGLTYNYPLNETAADAGVIHNIDPVTGSAYDGVWTPDFVYTEIPLNSRWLPCNEGGGNILFDKLNPAARTAGPNLATNGTFETLDAWDTETGWTIETALMRAKFIGLPAATKLKQALPTVAGKTYIVRFDLETIDGKAQQLAVGFGNNGTTPIGVGESASIALIDEIPGPKEVAIFAAADLTEFGFAAPVGAQIAISNVEVYLAQAIDTDAVIQNYSENWDTWPSTAPQPLVRDTYTDPDGTSLNGRTPDVGPAGVALSGTWNIDTNRARKPGVDAVDTFAYDSGAADVDVEVTVRFIGGTVDEAGICIRAVDSANVWLISAAGAGTLKIYERVGGVTTERATASLLFVADTDYRVRVLANGTTITAWVDGANEISYASATFQQTATLHGLYTYASIARLDDFTVYAATD